MKKYIVLIIGLLQGLYCFSQCLSCPPGTAVVLNGSSYPVGTTYEWVCSNGFTSSAASPSITPADDVTCYLRATSNGCVALDTVTVDVCICPVNDPCISADYNPSTNNIVVNRTGTNNSCVTLDVTSYRILNPLGSWTPITTFPFTVPQCSYQSSLTNLLAMYNTPTFGALFYNFVKCNCTSLKIDWVWSNPALNSTDILSCGTTQFQKNIPWSTLKANPTVDAYIQMGTPDGLVTRHYRFVYDGSGTYASDVQWQVVSSTVLFKGVEFRRQVTYCDGCPDKNCNIVVTPPNNPPGGCTTVGGWVSSFTAGAPCNGRTFRANVYNNSTPVTYLWKYNGVSLGITTQDLCMVGRPDGNYCVEIQDTPQCIKEFCLPYSTVCTLSGSLAVSGNLLQFNHSPCPNQTPIYKWYYAPPGQSNYLINGATSQNYNTAGVPGTYWVNVQCGDCYANGSYVVNEVCNVNVTLTRNGTSSTAGVTGCTGTKTYTWSFWNGSSWIVLSTATTTDNSRSFSHSSGSGLYKIAVTCGTCLDEEQLNYEAPNLCANFNAFIIGATQICNGFNQSFSASITAGTGPFTYEWKINTTVVSVNSTYLHTGNTNGSYGLSLKITDSNNCVVTAVYNFVVQSCCNLVATINGPTTACVSESVAFNGNYTGHTGQGTFLWTSSYNGGVEITRGYNQSLITSFTSAGNYAVKFTVTDQVGCVSSVTRNLSVTNCLNCNCGITLWVDQDCKLRGLFSGTGCSQHSYILEYSINGNSWSTYWTGVGGNNNAFIFNADANGFYRLRTTSQNCDALQTPVVTVSCVNPCACLAGSLTKSGCQLFFDNPCGSTGWTATLQKYIGITWTDITTSSPYTLPITAQPSYDGYQGGNYRVVYRKNTCNELVGNTLTITESPIVSVTTIDWDNYSNPATRMAEPHWWHYFSQFGGIPELRDHDWNPCIPVGERYLYMVNAQGVAPNDTSQAEHMLTNPDYFYTNTFTSNVPVSWMVSNVPGGPTGNYTILSQSTSQLVLKFRWCPQGGPQTCVSGNNICGLYQPAQIRYAFTVTAIDECGRQVYKVWVEGNNLG